MDGGEADATQYNGILVTSTPTGKKGVVSQTTWDPADEETEVLHWVLTNNEAYQIFKNNTTVSVNVRYSKEVEAGSGIYQYVYVTLTWTPKPLNITPAGEILNSDKISNYWYAENNATPGSGYDDIHANVETVGEVGANDEFKSDIEPEPYKEPIKEETTTSSANIPNGIVDILKDKTVKKRIRYENFKSTIGMLNMYISNGYFVVDLSGKWMHSKSVLGSLNKDNIREALQKVLNLQVVSFNLDKFIKHAQVFVCDVCLDLALDSKQQVERYIDGLSSFFPISTNRFNIAKYKRHGLMLKPKAQNGGFSLIVYSKGEELDCSVKRSSKATRYTIGIGAEGEKLAQRTLRFEAKFYKLKDARKYLGISKDENCVLSLNEVLNSKTPTILLMFELFSGQANVLLEHLEWLHDLVIKPDELTLKEIFLAERFIQILKENNFDLAIVRSHIKTEYINVSDTELEEFNRLSNQKRNVLNYLVYRKPKSITIMLDILNRIQRYYQIVTEKEGANG